MSATPLVTVLLPTQDRPEWLAIALRCFAGQDYPHRELLVLDDGAEHPVDVAAVAAVGGRVLRFDASLTLGAKLNAGAQAASGQLLQKWDDDDVYFPGFLSAHVAPFRDDPAGVHERMVVGCDRYLLTTLVDRAWWESRPGEICGLTCLPRRLWEAHPYPEGYASGTMREHLRTLADAGVRLHAIDGREHLLVARRDRLSGVPPHLTVGDQSGDFMHLLPTTHTQVKKRQWSEHLSPEVRKHFERQRWISRHAMPVSVILRATADTAGTTAALRDIADQRWLDFELLVYAEDAVTPISLPATVAARGRIVTPAATTPAARLDEVAAAATGKLVLLWPDALWAGPTTITDHVDPAPIRDRPANSRPVTGYHRHRVYLPARDQFYVATATPFASLCVPRALLATTPLSTLAYASPEEWAELLSGRTLALNDAPGFVARPPAAIAGDHPAATAALVDWLAAHPADTSASPGEVLPAHVRATLPPAPAPIGDPAWRPLVTVLLPTADRPNLVSTAIRAVAEQTWEPRELLVLDDGVVHPVDEALVAAAGGRVLRCPPGITLGEKLNIGAAAARGDILLKMDDDDYFAPGFIAAHVREWREHPLGLDAPIVVGCDRYPMLLIASWQVIARRHPRISGNFAIARRLWERLPYPIVHGHGTDTTYFEEANASGCHLARIDGRSHLLMTRRDGLVGVAQHTFHTYKNIAVADYYAERSDPDPRPAETLAPPWALAPLRAMRAAAAPQAEAPMANGLSLTDAHAARDDVAGTGGHAP